MRILFKKYPAEIILCMLWSLILFPIVILDEQGILSFILGLSFIFFVPGYILIFTLFPTRKSDIGIDIIERIALSFGLSIAVVPLIGLGLNYTPWDIRLESILFSIFIFIIGFGSVAIYRWLNTDLHERFTVSIDVSLPKSESKLDKALIIILSVAIIIAVVSLIYGIVIPKTGEKFTEFYLLGSIVTDALFPKVRSFGYPSALPPEPSR